MHVQHQICGWIRAARLQTSTFRSIRRFPIRPRKRNAVERRKGEKRKYRKCITWMLLLHGPAPQAHIHCINVSFLTVAPRELLRHNVVDQANFSQSYLRRKSLMCNRHRNPLLNQKICYCLKALHCTNHVLTTDVSSIVASQ